MSLQEGHSSTVENIIKSFCNYRMCHVYSFIASMCVYVCVRVRVCIVIVSGEAFIVLCKYSVLVLIVY